jgi:hypothetical protein
MLLLDCKSDNRHSTGTFCATDACTSGHDSTSSSSPQNPEPGTQKQHQRYLQEQRHAQHHHHLKRRTLQKQEPQRKGEISETIYFVNPVN